MAKSKSLNEEMRLLTRYLTSDSTENAKRPLLYPFFRKLYDDNFKIENDAKGADGYVEGVFILETKTDYSDWLAGFYQALHYHKSFGLAYQLILVIAHKFIGIWRVNQIPEHAFLLSHSASPMNPPNYVGKDNARKTPQHIKKEIEEAALYFIEPKRFDKIHQKNEAISFDFEGNPRFGIEFFWHEIATILKNSNAGRIQIDTHNFIGEIELLKDFFDHPIEAVHAFYTMIAYWDITSTVAANDYTGEVQLVGFKGQKLSDPIAVKPAVQRKFRKFVENRYVFTNEGSGLTVDYYFSRFDEVMAKIDPEYVKQHGIFFTDVNLSRFALWFAKRILGEQVNDLYIFFDPAGGSGNLISSWRGKQKHKIISELQPDLLRIIERRMRIDPWHVEKGFTIIPKTSENKGLNFLDSDAASYIGELEKELKLKNLQLDKPFAFLLNPPYKNIREHENARIETEAEYEIDESILEITGPDGSKERYLSFIAQILNISKLEYEKNSNNRAILIIFTPTSWLIPRIAFIPFRKYFDNYFKFLDGFLITSNDFFKLQGTWPLAFTIWQFDYELNRQNKIILNDFTSFNRHTLGLNWNSEDNFLFEFFKPIFSKAGKINLSKERNSIRELLPFFVNDSGIHQRQGMQNFYRSRNKEESGKKIISGFALSDDRHTRIKAPHGYVDGTYVGFMDDLSPVRIRPKNDIRYINKSAKNSIWFRLDTSIKDINKSKCFNGPTDNRSYCGYDIESSKVVCTWFAISKSIVGRYPIWANQSDIWVPEIPSAALPTFPKFQTLEKVGASEKVEHRETTFNLEEYWHAFCFAFVLAENRCVVTKFEKDNPVPGAPEIFVDNPLCPSNPEAFWTTTLDSHVSRNHGAAFELVLAIKELYKHWNLNYCKGQFIYNAGLKDEAYFRYFSYPDFLTPYSGLIQIRKYAEIHNLEDLQERFSEISNLTKTVRDELYRVLVEEAKYFG